MVRLNNRQLPGFDAGRNRQRKFQIPLTHKPNADCLEIFDFSKKLKSRHISKFRLGRNFCNFFAFESFHKTIVCHNNFGKTRRNLLKFALNTDVGVISSSVSENVESVSVINITAANPPPREMIKTRNISQSEQDEIQGFPQEMQQFQAYRDS